MAAAACPQIVTRAEWGARESKSVNYLTDQPVPYVFIHHSAGRECFNLTSCISVVRGYQNFHMDTRVWDDIGYSFVVGGDGTVFDGRGWDRIGAHTLGYNSVGLGICLSGDFTDHLPPQVQMDAAKSLIDCGMSLGKIDMNYTLRGHRDMKPSTTCPGDTLYAEIRTWPHYFLSQPSSGGVTTTTITTSFDDATPTSVDVTTTVLNAEATSVDVTTTVLNAEATSRLHEVNFDVNDSSIDSTDSSIDSTERAFTGSDATAPMSNIIEPSVYQSSWTGEWETSQLNNAISGHGGISPAVSLLASSVNDWPSEETTLAASLLASSLNDSPSEETTLAVSLLASSLNDSPSEETTPAISLLASSVNDSPTCLNEETVSAVTLTSDDITPSVSRQLNVEHR
ncbi:hypothetical protein Btru_069429 [Bulinus truncatus]|nr:hypothetical protein Btru_069429 [Bulinus truncatus]